MSERREEDWGNQDFAARLGPSPTPSKVGVVLLTLPPASLSGHAKEDEQELGDGFRFPAHPYTQGGRFTVTPRAPPIGPSTSGGGRGAEYAGAHPSHVSWPSQDGLLHPYAAAQAGARESYQGLVAQLCPDSDALPSAALWTVYSPSGVLCEVLPAALRYSLYISEFPDDGAQELQAPPRVTYDPNTPPIGPEARNSTMILDTVGVGEALANALATRELHTVAETSSELNVRTPPSHLPHRRPVQYDATRPSYFQTKSDSTAHTLASSRVQPAAMPDDFLQMQEGSPQCRHLSILSHASRRLRRGRYSPSGSGHLDTPAQQRKNASSGSSPGITSLSSSPQMSPHRLGSVDDPNSFHDLVYRPGASPPMNGSFGGHRSSGSGAHEQRGSGVSWGSGITALARQLSAELQEIAEYQRLAPGGGRRDSSEAQFLHDDDSQYAGPRDSRYTLEAESRYTVDAESRYTRDTDSCLCSGLAVICGGGRPASSDLGDELGVAQLEDDDAVQMGLAVPPATPPADSSDPRRSFTGDMAYSHDHEVLSSVSHKRSDLNTPSHSDERGHSLQPPSLQAPAA
ncbi:hypothetical protein BD626DRAFT_571298 [Schizophyllum amplum]|uniref:Uncharacterized protein n=1 Tax=Schizophyllum amplum TaxID=97359 RepID=A0A550C889_9AGAR|nr:hypothetical protein BD626DRAFT_571298 [Auriculariopsis ampla]